MIRCILYDLDGVLVDACEWHYEALNQALEECGCPSISRKDHESKFNGLSTKKKLEMMASEGSILQEDIDKVSDLKQVYTKERASSLKFDPVKVRLHEYCKRRGIKIGCVSNAIYDSAHSFLSKSGQLNYMDLVYGNDSESVAKNKPWPHPYAAAMKALELQPEDVLIVEDSQKGLQSAVNSDANVFHVKNSEDVNLHNIKAALRFFKETEYNYRYLSVINL